MSYNLSIRVKAEGCDIYPEIARPELCSPTYNLGEMFRKCMDWHYKQSEKNSNGRYETCYYRCDEIIPKIERGIKELKYHHEKYEKYNPSNGWGNLNDALNVLLSLRACIYEQAEEIPLNCLYMTW